MALDPVAIGNNDSTRPPFTFCGSPSTASPPGEEQFSSDRPTVLVVHPREKRRKCTLEPLRGTPGFVFWKFPRRGPQPLAGYVRLALEGPLLTPADRPGGLLILDGTWKRAAVMEREFHAVPPRSLLPWRTAYPRTSKVREDPHAGLATIEALYAASLQMGREVEGILDHYHWADDFLAANADLIASIRLTIAPARPAPES
jgi:pre-rRNA-processing protein TSR3